MNAGIVVPQRLTLQLIFIFYTFAKVNLDRSVSDDIQAFPSWTCFSFRQLFHSNSDPKLFTLLSFILFIIWATVFLTRRESIGFVTFLVLFFHGQPKHLYSQSFAAIIKIKINQKQYARLAHGQ